MGGHRERVAGDGFAIDQERIELVAGGGGGGQGDRFAFRGFGLVRRNAAVRNADGAFDREFRLWLHDLESDEGVDGVELRIGDKASQGVFVRFQGVGNGEGGFRAGQEFGLVAAPLIRVGLDAMLGNRRHAAGRALLDLEPVLLVEGHGELCRAAVPFDCDAVEIEGTGLAAETDELIAVSKRQLRGFALLDGPNQGALRILGIQIGGRRISIRFSVDGNLAIGGRVFVPDNRHFGGGSATPSRYDAAVVVVRAKLDGIFVAGGLTGIHRTGFPRLARPLNVGCFRFDARELPVQRVRRCPCT